MSILVVHTQTELHVPVHTCTHSIDQKMFHHDLQQLRIKPVTDSADSSKQQAAGLTPAK